MKNKNNKNENKQTTCNCQTCNCNVSNKSKLEDVKQVVSTQKKYMTVTFGCQMNVHESEKIAGILEGLGYSSTDKKEEADIITFNTCCIREGAEDRAIGNIGALKKIKEKNKNLIIAVGGCMTQKKDTYEKLITKFPYIDIIFGTQNLDKFKTFLETRLNSGAKIREIEEGSPLPVEGEVFRTSENNAYININYGCNNYCTYCIVPYVRGKERSRSKQEIVDEFKKLISQKKSIKADDEEEFDFQYKTITLLGQNVNSYGSDLKGENFTTLLSSLVEICKEAKIKGEIANGFKIKYMTNHPKDFNEELITFISKNLEFISDEIHLPAQSGSSKILKLMNRNHTREDYLSRIDLIKKLIPTARLSTDIIVGFPGESEEDYLETESLIKEVKFVQVFAYMYSIRSGTPATKMQNQIDDNIKHERVNRLLKIVREIGKSKNKTRKEVNNKEVKNKIGELKTNKSKNKTDKSKTKKIS